MSGSLVRDSHRRVVNEVTTHEEDAMRVTLEQVETAMNHVAAATEYLRLARREAKRVYSDDRIVGADAKVAVQYLQDAIKTLTE
jgi:hypothetical protein